MFNSIHLAIPVRNLANAIAFFKVMFLAEIICYDPVRRHCTVAYDKFEFSLFEIANFSAWKKGELGPFHIGHELATRAEVDAKFETAMLNGYAPTSRFDRDDGDYAFFIRDEQGIMFEFYFGSHHKARARHTSPSSAP